MSSSFEWTTKKREVALGLAEGRTQQELAAENAMTDRGIRKWLAEPAFSEEVDRLSLMIGLASRAERLRHAKRMVREAADDVQIRTAKDLLDWLKYIQSETDGTKSELAASLADLISSVAERGSGETESAEAEGQEPG